MKDHQIYDIVACIVKYLTGELRDDEKEYLHTWVEESSAHRELLEQLENAKVSEREIKRMFSHDVSKGWNGVLMKVRKRRIINRLKWFSGVAAIVLISLGSFLFLHLREEVQIADTMATISAGRLQARLTVADGICYELDSSTVEIPNTLIRNGNEYVFGGRDSIRKVAERARYHKLEIPRGGEYRIILDDGTSVYLNSQTELRFPEYFAAGKVREVYLKGEAFFDVAKDKTRPFIVRCGAYDVQVTGTSFNVSNYADNICSHTTLTEGSVMILHGNSKIPLQPGQQARLQAGNVEVKEVNVENYTTWMNEYFRFGSENMEDLLKRLSRWYEVEIFFVNPEVKDYHFSGYLPRHSEIVEVLRLLEMTANIRFEVKGRTVIVMKK